MGSSGMEWMGSAAALARAAEASEEDLDRVAEVAERFQTGGEHRVLGRERVGPG